MAYVNVDLDVFDTDVLIEELESRRLSNRNNNKLKEIIETDESSLDVCSTVEDELKLKHFLNVWKKYSLEQLEKTLK